MRYPDLLVQQRAGEVRVAGRCRSRLGDGGVTGDHRQVKTMTEENSVMFQWRVPSGALKGVFQQRRPAAAGVRSGRAGVPRAGSVPLVRVGDRGGMRTQSDSFSLASASRSGQAADRFSPRARPHRALPALPCLQTTAAARPRPGRDACGWHGVWVRRSGCGSAGRVRPSCSRNCWPGCGRGGRWRG